MLTSPRLWQKLPTKEEIGGKKTHTTLCENIETPDTKGKY